MGELTRGVLSIVDAAARSDIGRRRAGNEDSFLFEPPLFVVADGMGGARAGEVASRSVIREFATSAAAIAAGDDSMRAAIVRANEEIYREAQSSEQLHGMGTTTTAALIGGGSIQLAHVGDSRAYRLRGGALTRITPDHSLVDELVRRGAISEEEAEHHPQRSLITRAVGIAADVEVDEFSHPVSAGDVYLLCSDGLTKMVSEEEILATLRAGASATETAGQLIEAANRHGGEDNITAVLVHVAGR